MRPLSTGNLHRRATTHVLKPIAPGINNVASGRKTSDENAEKKLGTVSLLRVKKKGTRRAVSPSQYVQSIFCSISQLKPSGPRHGWTPCPTPPLPITGQ